MSPMVKSQRRHRNVCENRYPRPAFGGMPERPKGADCKSAGYAYGGSNPPPTTGISDEFHFDSPPFGGESRSCLCGFAPLPRGSFQRGSGGASKADLE